mgnify:CR=1 FL=1
MIPRKTDKTSFEISKIKTFFSLKSSTLLTTMDFMVIHLCFGMSKSTMGKKGFAPRINQSYLNENELILQNCM